MPHGYDPWNGFCVRPLLGLHDRNIGGWQWGQIIAVPIPPLSFEKLDQNVTYTVTQTFSQVGLFTEIGPLSCFVSRHVSAINSQISLWFLSYSADEHTLKVLSSCYSPLDFFIGMWIECKKHWIVFTKRPHARKSSKVSVRNKWYTDAAPSTTWWIVIGDKLHRFVLI